MKLNTSEMVDHFPEIVYQYTVSKDEVWEDLESRTKEPEHSVRIISFTPLYRIAVAASLLLILGMTGFFRFYTKNVYAPAGQRITFYLPDSSFINLNAQSLVSFHPYWFRFSRTVKLDGEAFFGVVKGNTFQVESELGETTVLGTTFNIYSRDKEYSVTCITGKVRVISMRKTQKVLLHPNEQAFINNDGLLSFVKKVNPETALGWRNNMFVFTGSSIVGVLKEIERNYNIKIQFQADPGLTYTGNFSRSLSGKEVLDLVCTSLGIKFEAKSDNEFLVR